MIGEMPFLVEGEIIEVQKASVGYGNEIHYVCEVFLPGNQIMLLPNVKQASFLGGISDYFRRRALSREDADDSYPTEDAEALQDNNLNASIGERVYIAFLGGSLQHPVIVGFRQHPNQTDEALDSTDFETQDPKTVMQLLGMRFSVDSSGQFRVVHKGAPEVKFAPRTDGALGALGAITGSSSSDADGDDNPAIEPADPENLSIFEMLDDGVIAVRNSGKSIFKMDAPKQTILLSANFEDDDNKFNDLSLDAGGLAGAAAGALSALAGSSVNSTSVEINGADDIVTIQSDFGDIVTISGAEGIKGSTPAGLGTEFSFDSGEVFIRGSRTELTMNKDGFNIKDPVGATLSLSNGQVALGNPNLPAGPISGAKAEVLDILEKLCNLLAAEAPAGFGAPLLGVASYTDLIAVITALKGSL